MLPPHFPAVCATQGHLTILAVLTSLVSFSTRPLGVHVYANVLDSDMLNTSVRIPVPSTPKHPIHTLLPCLVSALNVLYAFQTQSFKKLSTLLLLPFPQLLPLCP